MMCPHFGVKPPDRSALGPAGAHIGHGEGARELDLQGRAAVSDRVAL